MSPDEELEYYKKAYKREKQARKEAERILESKAKELYEVNKKILHLNANLEQELFDRTERIKEAEEKHRKLVETANDVIFRVNLSGQFTYINHTGASLSGYDRKELIGKSFTLLVEDDFKSKLIQLYQDQLKNEIESTYAEYKAIDKSGQEIWLGQNVQILYENGFPSEFLAVARNITKRVRSDNELRRSEEKYKKMFEGAFDGVLRMNNEGRFIEWNTKMESMLGYSSGELEGMKITDIVHPEDRAKTKVYLKELLNEGFYINYTGRVFNKSGDTINVEINSSVTSENGNINGSISNVRDISERVAIEKAIVRNEEKYRGILENLELGLLEVSRDEKIIKVYPSFCKLTGYSEEDLIGKDPSRFLLHPDSEEIMRAQNKHRTQGKASVYEVQIKKKTGEYKWVIISGAPFYDEKGKFAGSIGVHLDISQNKKLEEDLKAANEIAQASSKAKELFLANMSHEIRTPLNAVIGLSNLLKKTNLTNNQIDYVSNINNSASSLLLLVNDILDISKIESGKLELDQAVFDIRKSLNTILSSAGYLAEKKKLKLVLNVDDQLHGQYLGDELKMCQVLINLINNAIKFTAEGSVIINFTKLDSDPGVDKVEIAVVDTGKGIVREALENIFDDFSQEDNTISKQFGGTGLGLSISKKLVALLGGDLKVESELKKGTKFSFVLELPHGAIPVEEEGLIEIEWEKVQILTVEDNPVNQFVISETISGWNGKTDLANNGQEALQMMNDKEYDIVLMDLHMPVMDGIATTKFIRQEMKLDIPIIAFTANALKKERERCLRTGMNDYVSKPFEEKTLKNKMIHLLLSDSRNELKPLEVTQVESSNVQPFFTVERLLDLSRGDDAFVNKMLRIFIEDGQKQLELISSTDDLDLIPKIAHKIKPSIDYISNDDFKQLVRQIENNAFLEQPELLEDFKLKLSEIIKLSLEFVEK